jgi:lipopolysaccharide/colanic/teichoic acid biosynthesis glycosyltransferase
MRRSGSETTLSNTLHHTSEIEIGDLEGLTQPVSDLRVPTARPSTSKRVFDLAIALPAALVTLPLVGGLMAMSVVKLRSTPLFTQPRLGAGGKQFRFWKVRSLPPVAPDAADKYQLRSLQMPNFSHVVRHRHLDELPQLWQVVSGQMSLVGPRPEMPTLSATFDPAFVAERLSVKPGLTGLWQVSVDSRALIGESPDWDLHYVRNRTLRLDVWICYRTILMMTKFTEVESLDEIPRWTGAAIR